MVFSGSLPPGAVLRSQMKRAASPALAEAEVLEAVERQVGEGVVDHQVVDVRVRDAGLGEGLLPRDAERREEVKSSIWLTIGVSTLSPVPRM